MAAKNKFMNAMKMPAIADMFSSEADRQRESGDLVTEVPLSELHPFVNHPFEVRDDEDMQKLVDSIKENGVYQNLTVIPGHYLNSREYIAKCVDEGRGMQPQQRQHGHPRLCGPVRTTPSSSATAGAAAAQQGRTVRTALRHRGDGRAGADADHDD